MIKKKLSIIIPIYNEKNTITKLLEKVYSVKLINNFDKEIILVDDCSDDGSREIIKNYQNVNLKKIFHSKNQGKGSAISSALKEVTGNFVVIQDADLEYDPSEYNLLLEPVILHNANIVYGSRFITGKYRRVLYFKHYLVNKFLTFLSNIITNLNLTDMETCYKLIDVNILKQIKLKEKRFGFEPEITIKLAKILEQNKNLKFFEIGISYNGRTYEEGKKIKWKDGVRALYCLIFYKFSKVK